MEIIPTIQVNDNLETRILKKIRELSTEQVVKLEQYLDSQLADLDYQQWDKQIEKDVALVNLDNLAAEAIAESDFQLINTAMRLAEPTFKRVWDNPDDSAYENI